MKITDACLTNPNARPGRTIVPKGLVVHWTANKSAGANAMANRHYFNKPTTVASAHYIVDDKQIVRCLPETEMGYHVGAKAYKPEALVQLSSYPNNCTIGIEMCVNADSKFSEMFKLTVELVVQILKRYGWGVDKLWRHYDVTGKNCPAFFVSDPEAKAYCGMPGAQAWQTFKAEVLSLLTDHPQNSELPVDSCRINLALEVQGYLQQGIAYLPVRAVAEAAGGSVEWEPQTKSVKVNGREVTVQNLNGISYTPARELAANLGLQVEWDEGSKTVTLRK
jgi:N-acetylmuramoyl-L-alanine amidase